LRATAIRRSDTGRSDIRLHADDFRHFAAGAAARTMRSSRSPRHAREAGRIAWGVAAMSETEINTLVQHYVCRIFQDSARMLGVPVIAIRDADAGRLNRAAADLEEILAHFVERHAALLPRRTAAIDAATVF
jgi:hypothetical protein